MVFASEIIIHWACISLVTKHVFHWQTRVLMPPDVSV